MSELTSKRAMDSSLAMRCSPWFRTTPVDAALARIDEPFVHELVRANIWWFRGRDRDLVVDTGLGVASLRTHLPRIFDRDPIVVLTHAHLDHMGGAHEFGGCRAHSGEPFLDPPPGSLYTRTLLTELGTQAGVCESADTMLIDALPRPGYRVADYRLQPPRQVSWVSEGAPIDLGDCTLTVLHLPGHTPASIALFDETSGVLYSGDVVYDDVLIDDCIGSDVAAYRRTMQRLLELDVAVVHPGHGVSFDKARLDTIARSYLDATDA